MSFDLRNREDGDQNTHVLSRLPKEDLDLILELVVCSGSLKDLASSYRVSYPTIRMRLDKVIERVRALRNGSAINPMTELLAGMIERGEVTPAAARSIREEHKRALSERSGPPQHAGT